ncbi:hypothetical protein Q4Q57_13150 [Shewanella sp. SP2S2-6]|uniref:hypothetical protein n=1 Tax=Shewanella sp. SP2S2-6 TaxID=3063540 RepID=UPI00288F963C|nr:hypothetical protein [Shewanella sp. SP2S2-6]MDT3296088.1 hypothetical protein [Shewanella sp. SP2S2-6]
MKVMTIELVSNESGLLTGRSNGQRARSKYHVKPADRYVLSSDGDLLITSSYFLGLIGEELSLYSTPNDALEHLDLEGLSPQSQEECIKAVKRGLFSGNAGLI